MDIKATDVKKLREKTGAGMMECKKALVESAGDFAKAVKILKELGLAAAKKRDGRVTKEGRIFVKLTPSKAIVLEILCETDFVAKNKDFIALGEKLVAAVDEKNYTQPNDELQAIVKETIAVIKENIALKRFVVMEATENELMLDYIHGEGRIGVVTKLKLGDAALKSNEKVKELCFDICLHIAAFAPSFLDRSQIDAEYLKEQEEIFTKQAQNLGKPEKVIAGIVKGKLSKHMAEICLVDQNFVKDEKQTVAAVLKNLGKELGCSIEIADFIYYKLGADNEV